MYKRKINVYYSFDDTNVTFELNEENYMHYQTYTITYEIDKFGDWVDLYNKLLDDFEVEYDDKIPNMLESLCAQFWEEKEKCDSVTQE